MSHLNRSQYVLIALGHLIATLSFVACELETNGTIPDGSSSGNVGGMGGEKICIPDQRRACYSGPVNTANVGTCASGIETCLADGTAFGECIGETLPIVENCVLPGDQDCDGLADIDDPECECTVANALVDCDTGQLGACGPGRGLCAEDGRSISTCIQVALPLPENCATVEDDDCDGIAAPMCTGNPLWTYAPPSGNGLFKDDAIFSVAIAPNNEYVVVGMVDGALGADGYGVTTGTAYIAKLSSDKKVIWEKRFTSTSYAVARSVAVEKNGNIIVGGSFLGIANIADMSVTSNGVDGFLVKYDAAGTLLASRKISDGGTQDIVGIAVDPLGNYCAIGSTSGGINFDGNMQTATSTDFYVTCSRPDNTSLWSKIFKSGGVQYGRGIAMTSDGDVIVVGNADNTNTNLGAGDIARGGDFDFFVARYAHTDGAYRWGNLYGQTKDQRANGLTIGAGGQVFVTGEFTGTIDWKNGSTTVAASTTTSDVFLAQLDAQTGNQLKAQSGGQSGTATGTSVATDLAGNITLFGHFNGSIHFGNPTGPTASSTGTTDTFLVKLRNTDWSHVWTIAYGKSGNQYGWSVAVTGDGTTITGGEFYGDLDVPTAPLISATSGADLFAVLASP